MASDADSVNARLLELIEARRLAYAQGYRDAVQNIMAAAGAVDAAPATKEEPHHPGLRILRRQPTQRAPWGLVPKAIEGALDKAGDRGIDFPMVNTFAVELGHPVAESSVRTFLINMTKRGVIERRGNGRSYRVKRNDGVPDQERPAVSNPFDQGGSNETALAL